MTDDARRSATPRASSDASHQPRLQGERPRRRSADANLQQALGIMTQRGFPLRRARRRSRDCPNSRRCATTAGRSRTTRSRISISISRRFEQQRRRAPAARCIGARTAAEARAAVLAICRARRRQDRHQGQVDDRRGDRRSTSISRQNGITPVETDLGEYIIQLRHEPPSHIIAPAIHLVEGAGGRHLPRSAHRALDPTASARRAARRCATRRAALLRQQFLAADVGITGANFLIAETGSSDHRHQRGQRRPDPDPAARAYRAGQPRKAGADARGRGDPAAPAGALGDRPGVLVLHDGLDRPAPAGRPRRTRGLSRRAARQRPQRDARQRVPGHAALHPLRRLHEPLPGLCRGRRPCLWLGLSRADGRGADARR